MMDRQADQVARFAARVEGAVAEVLLELGAVGCVASRFTLRWKRNIMRNAPVLLERCPSGAGRETVSVKSEMS